MMTVEDIHEYAHNIARNYNMDDYEDVFQQATVFLLEAEGSGVKGVDCFWEARFRTNLWANYQDRLVTLPVRTGSKALAEAQDTSHEVQDHIASVPDHTEAFELYSEIQHMIANLSKLTESEASIIHEIYVMGRSTRDLAAERGGSHQMWHKKHSAIINKLKSLQDKI